MRKICDVLIDDLPKLLAGLTKEGLVFTVTAGRKVACWDITITGY